MTSMLVQMHVYLRLRAIRHIMTARPSHTAKATETSANQHASQRTGKSAKDSAHTMQVKIFVFMRQPYTKPGNAETS